tara:strand:- start:1865 stop:2191 length:327 start_codon:yes stop_codon:yes gene_type:complete
MLRANDYDTPFAPGTLIYHEELYTDHVGILLQDNVEGGTMKIYDTVEQEEVWFVRSECFFVDATQYRSIKKRIEKEVNHARAAAQSMTDEEKRLAPLFFGEFGEYDHV